MVDVPIVVFFNHTFILFETLLLGVKTFIEVALAQCCVRDHEGK